MNNFNKKIRNLQMELEGLEKELDRMEKGEEEIEVGVISVKDGKLKIELLMNPDAFTAEDLEHLGKIVNDFHELLFKIQERSGE